MNNTYTITHIHTMLSNGVTNIDSVTSYEDYIEFIKENKDKYGINALCFTEHGNIFEWYKKKEAIENIGLKYVHSIEAYVTETLDEKVRDNYHICLYAKNYNGFLELNKLSTKSFNRNDNHFYYVPRITYDELINTSDNILISTACLGGILNKSDNELKNKFINFLIENKNRCYLEIQHHVVPEQIEYNKELYTLHKKTNIPLIVGTDTHALNKIHAKGRSILQKSKRIFFDNEEGWDLTLKSYDELIELFKKQNVIPEKEIKIALENTNKLYDKIEEFVIDKSYKYPKLYKNPKQTVKNKILKGIKEKNINKLDNFKSEYIPRIKHEMETFEHNEAFDFLLLDEEIKNEMRKQGVYCGYSRGSVSGSIVAYLLGMIDIDGVKHNLNFDRFMNVEKVSLADVDTDWQPNHRELVKNYCYNREGLYCCDIITFNTIALRGSIRDVCKAIYKREENDNGEYLKIANYICDNIDDNEEQMRKEYPNVFEYVDIINGTIISIGTHPSGLVVSPITLDDHMGLCSISTCEHPISIINMKEIDAQNFVKLDILGLENMRLINETCELVGIERLTPENTPDEEEVWKSMRDDNTLIFQWESDSAKQFLQKLLSDETIEKIKKKNPNFTYLDLVSMGNGAIRPAGESYREALANGEFRDNGNKALNNMLASTSGFLVYQEQIIEFLHKFCGFTMGEADVVRRGFAKKTGTEKFIPIIKNGGYLNENKKNHYIKGFLTVMNKEFGLCEEDANKILEAFIKVIEDASSYLFSYNHALPYTYIGYICAYLRYHYPLEFLTVALNSYYGNSEKTTKITQLCNKLNIKIDPPTFKYSKSKYMPDKATNSIYKGLHSIKYLNEECSEGLYELKYNKYETFIDLLYDIKEKVNINTRQMSILIKLNFFREFGNNKKLLMLYDYFDNLNDKKQLSKSKLNELKLTESVVRMFSKKETEKIFKEIDFKNMFKLLESKIPNKQISLKEQLKAEIEYLGYITKINTEKPLYFTLEIKEYKNKKSSTFYPLLYNIKTGEEIKYRIDSCIRYMENPFKEGDIISIIEEHKKQKRTIRKDENGNTVLNSKGKPEWDLVPNEFNNILDYWNVY